MLQINESLLTVPKSYLFQEIGRRVEAYRADHPDADIIKLGIGDAVLPPPPCVINRGVQALQDMGTFEGFKGYPPAFGHLMLREMIAQMIYQEAVPTENIFVSTGAKEDTSRAQRLFGKDIRVLIPDPVYPVYLESNIMSGRRENITFLEATTENDFLPSIPTEEGSVLVYLCCPNNPTGVAAPREYLQAWIDYAKKTGSVIFFDAAYSAFIRDANYPASIFELEGAHDVAVEFGSFSKSHGFTGKRVAYTAVGENVKIVGSDGREYFLRDQWASLLSRETNGVAHELQAQALAALSDPGLYTSREQTDYYLENARLMKEMLHLLGLHSVGGTHSPYVWVQTPDGMSGWDFFDRLLNECQLVCTPGEGFGTCGKGYFRLSAFAIREKVDEAMERLSHLEL